MRKAHAFQTEGRRLCVVSRRGQPCDAFLVSGTRSHVCRQIDIASVRFRPVADTVLHPNMGSSFTELAAERAYHLCSTRFVLLIVPRASVQLQLEIAPCSKSIHSATSLGFSSAANLLALPPKHLGFCGMKADFRSAD